MGTTRFVAKGLERLAPKGKHLRDDLGRFASFAYRDAIENVMRGSIADSMVRAWASQGGSIGEDWSPHDLVKTGALFSSMSTPSQLLLLAYSDGRFYFGSAVEHALYATRWGEYRKIDAQALRKIKQGLRSDVQRRIAAEMSA